MTKTLLMTMRILQITFKGKDFIIPCDTTHSDLGVVLMLGKNFIDYASRKFKVHEKNYSKHDFELIAVVFSINV